ncbi:hypothetical protein Tco_1447480 [Tanacetum coccineum]
MVEVAGSLKEDLGEKLDVEVAMVEEKEEWKTRVRWDLSLWLVVRSVWMVGLEPVEEKSKVVVLSLEKVDWDLVDSRDIKGESVVKAFGLEGGADD